MKGGENPMTTNKQTITNRDSARITGIQKYCMSQSSILVGGVAYTPASAIQVYQNDLDATAAVAQAKTALKGLLAKAASARSAADSFDSAFKACIEGAYAGQPDTLEDFGIVVGARNAPSAATKATAAEKAAITRAARHIMSKKQRSMIEAPSGTDTEATTTPTPAPAGSGVAAATKS
jgi:hypothetical protein